MTFLQELAVVVEQRTGLETELARQYSPSGDRDCGSGYLLVDGYEVGIFYFIRQSRYHWIHVKGRCVVRGRVDRKQALAQAAVAVFAVMDEVREEAGVESAREAVRQRTDALKARVRAAGIELTAYSESSATVYVSLYDSPWVSVPADVSDDELHELKNILHEYAARLAAWQRKHETPG